MFREGSRTLTSSGKWFPLKCVMCDKWRTASRSWWRRACQAHSSSIPTWASSAAWRTPSGWHWLVYCQYPFDRPSLFFVLFWGAFLHSVPQCVCPLSPAPCCAIVTLENCHPQPWIPPTLTSSCWYIRHTQCCHYIGCLDVVAAAWIHGSHFFYYAYYFVFHLHNSPPSQMSRFIDFTRQWCARWCVITIFQALHNIRYYRSITHCPHMCVHRFTGCCKCQSWWWSC